LFSVIVPLFNKERSIAVTLNSVLNQTINDFEVIVVNDGSTDNSLQIARSFKDERIRVFTQENKGVSAARNVALDLAQNEYVSFLDADDYWEPNYLEEISKLIKKYPEYSVFICAYRVLGQIKISTKCDALSEGVINDFFEARMKHHIMRTSTVTAHKDVISSVGNFPEGMKGGEDDFTWMKIALKYKIVLTPKILATYDNRNSTFNQRRGQMDACPESWLNFYEEGNYFRNEFIAAKAITAGIRYAYGAPQQKSLDIEKATRFTTLSKEKWRHLFILNRIPPVLIRLIKIAKPAYKQAKFWLARKKSNLKNNAMRLRS
jgi:glycosyltransferase involved in cell wall biosynthesis